MEKQSELYFTTGEFARILGVRKHTLFHYDDYRTKYDAVKDEPVELVACPYFTTSIYDMTEEISCDYSELDSFVIFICIEGVCKLKDNENNELTLRAGETVLLPASTEDVTITPEEGGSVKILETYV